MNKQKKMLFKNSRITGQRMANKATKSESLIDEESTFPIYMVVSSHDKNDDIMIIHPRYSSESLKNIEYNPFAPNDVSGPEDTKRLPGDKTLRKMEEIHTANLDDNVSTPEGAGKVNSKK